jgi:hypothetical protein
LCRVVLCVSFLSRKPARPGGRGSDAGRDDEYDDYDGYAQDAYQNEDDSWSPNEYFSPEGIKGRWAGEQPDGRAGGRGRRGEAGPGYESYPTDFNGADYGGSPGYGADEFATGVYDLPDGADEDRSDRGRRRRRDREDRGERTGILRLRRDRGEDIWPDDGISDEDYWASVASDRPLNGTDSPIDNFPGAGGGTSASAGPRPGADGRPRMDGRAGSDTRFGNEQRGADRGGSGRLGPPPGLAGDYKPGAPGNGGTMGSAGATGGQPGGGRSGSGPIAKRPGTGPQPARPGTGPTPSVGVTASRPPAGQNGMRPGPAQPGSGTNGYPQPSARPSFQPNGYQAAGSAGGPTGSGPAGGSRPQDRGDWGDRTERIDRVNASGYPDPRPAGRGQGSAAPRTSGPLGRAAGYGSAPPASPGFSPAAGRGRGDNARPENARPDNTAWQAPDRREPDRNGHGRESSGSWPAQTRGATRPRGGADEDPLTSKAYSRSAQSETDGRSYRVAARRSQAQTQLTDQAETFITGRYQQSGQHRADRPGDYWYRDDAPASATQATAARYSAPNGQVPGTSAPGVPGPGSQGPGNHSSGNHSSGNHSGRPAQPGRGQAGTGRGPGSSHGAGPAQGGQPGRGGAQGVPGLPGASGPGAAPYDRPSQPRPGYREPEPNRQPSRPQLPAAAAPGNGLAVSGGASAASAGPSTVGGQNPYDAGVAGSYPYPGQHYGPRQATTGPAPDVADDRYHRPSVSGGYPANGSGQGGSGQGRGDQGRNGYANGYPASSDRRH